MYKITLLIFSVLFFTFFVYAIDNKSISYNFDDDYFVGLKAYDDGLYDVAQICLTNYLKHENQSEKAGFATYILYQVYMAQNDYQAAKEIFAKLNNFQDDRFDKKKILEDEMIIEINLSCSSAFELLTENPKNEYLDIFLKSDCNIHPEITQIVSQFDISVDNLYLLLNKVQTDKDVMVSIYNNLPLDKKSDKLMNFYGKYFYSNNLKEEFYGLYQIYKDNELVYFMLDDIWNAGDYKKYVDIFKQEVQDEYNLDKIVYCRMVEAANKESIDFNCNLIDRCFTNKDGDFNKTKLSCFMKTENKENISSFISKLQEKDALELCEHAKYIVGKQLYNISYLNKFEKCLDKVSMYESLLKFKDYNGILKLGGLGDTELDMAYLAIAHYFLKNNGQYNNYLNKLTDINLSGMVRNYTR